MHASTFACLGLIVVKGGIATPFVIAGGLALGASDVAKKAEQAKDAAKFVEEAKHLWNGRKVIHAAKKAGIVTGEVAEVVGEM